MYHQSDRTRGQTIKQLELTVAEQKVSRKPTPEIKVIKILVHKDLSTEPIAEYLRNRCGLKFAPRDSDLAYGGEEFLRGVGESVVVTIVPTQNLKGIPRKFRKPGWLYVKIVCTLDDSRFNDFPGYEIVQAGDYQVD